LAEPVTSQFMVFFYTILTGVLAGFLYDVYAGIGYVIRLKKIGTLLGDIIYWVCLTILVYALLLNYNQGEVRFFVLLGLGTGALVYFRLSRRWMRKLVIKTIELLIRLVNWLVAILFFPIRMLMIILTFSFKLLSLVLSKFGHMAIKILKRLVPAPIKSLLHRWQKLFTYFISKVKRIK